MCEPKAVTYSAGSGSLAMPDNLHHPKYASHTMSENPTVEAPDAEYNKGEVRMHPYFHFSDETFEFQGSLT